MAAAGQAEQPPPMAIRIRGCKAVRGYLRPDGLFLLEAEWHLGHPQWRLHRAPGERGVTQWLLRYAAGRDCGPEPRWGVWDDEEDYCPLRAAAPGGVAPPQAPGPWQGHGAPPGGGVSVAAADDDPQVPRLLEAVPRLLEECRRRDAQALAAQELRAWGRLLAALEAHSVPKGTMTCARLDWDTAAQALAQNQLRARFMAALKARRVQRGTMTCACLDGDTGAQCTNVASTDAHGCFDFPSDIQ